MTEVAEASRQQEEGTPERAGFGSLGTVMGLLVVAWGAAIASFPLNDNSFLTHLATGRLILDRGSVPSSDPYTFTAAGEAWTVQSWLASVAYAGAERAGGLIGLRLLVLALFAVAAVLVWRLSAAAESLFARLAIAAGAMFVCTELWSARPYMVGVIGLGLVWLALDGAVPAWTMAPLLWVWANSHGSFPLATVLVVAVLAGEWLDRRRVGAVTASPRFRDDVAGELRVLVGVLVGTVAAIVGPLGLQVLLFPLKAVTRSDVLAEVVEWKAPEFTSVGQRVFLLMVLAAFAAMVRGGRWRTAVPAMVFIGAALVAQRNVVMATIVLVPVLAAAAPRIGTLTSRSRPGLATAFGAVGVCAALLLGTFAVTRPVSSFDSYPGAALRWLDTRQVPVDVRVASQDFTGNLRDLLDGPRGVVFVDDRADMFPEAVVADYLSLLRGAPGWSAVLRSYDVDIVVWDRSQPLGSLLAADPGWRTAFADDRWVVACRRGRDVCAGLTSGS